MDGIEATRIIREEIGTEYAKTVPIIAFTANALTGNEEMFLSKGFQSFITKPVDVDRLDAVLKQWVRNEELEKNMTEQQIVVGGETVFDIRTGIDRRSGGDDRRKGYDRRVLAEKVQGVNINKGLERFHGDWETLLQIMKSFASNTRSVIELIKEVDKKNLPHYAIIVHGIKSSCRGISAEAAGNQAEALEKAAKAGDMDFVQKNNQAFIEVVTKLMTELDEVFKDDEIEKVNKPKKDKPYAEVISKLGKACSDFAINEIEAIMDEIEVFDYTSDDGLVSWLHENVEQMNYMEIAEKLQGEYV
jgi:HPt (histidine-containing phosphotransfer) domain-containing protein